MPEPYYRDDAVTLYHGDCRDVLRALTLGEIGLVLADPPYGREYVSGKSGRGGTTNDSARLSLRLYRETLPLLNAAHVLWFTRWDVWPYVHDTIGAWWPLRGLLVWDKGHPGMGDLRHWGASYELIASAGYGGISGGRDGSVLRFPWYSTSAKHHANEKPVALLQYLIGKLDAKVTLDPFCGSGSTLVAAKGMGRQAVGIEVEEKHCETAARRLSQQALDLGGAA